MGPEIIKDLTDSRLQGPEYIRVCSKRCNECLFTANKIVSDSRREYILKQAWRRGKHFTCHKASVIGLDVVCRGFYDNDPGATAALRLGAHLGRLLLVDTTALTKQYEDERKS